MQHTIHLEVIVQMWWYITIKGTRNILTWDFYCNLYYNKFITVIDHDSRQGLVALALNHIILRPKAILKWRVCIKLMGDFNRKYQKAKNYSLVGQVCFKWTPIHDYSSQKVVNNWVNIQIDLYIGRSVGQSNPSNSLLVWHLSTFR